MTSRNTSLKWMMLLGLGILVLYSCKSDDLPPGITLSDEAQATIDRLESTPPLPVQIALANLVDDAVANGDWEKMWCLQLWNLDTEANSKINLKGSTSAAEFVGDAPPLWTQYVGIQGTSSLNSGMDLKFNPSVHVTDLNNAAYGIFVLERNSTNASRATYVGGTNGDKNTGFPAVSLVGAHFAGNTSVRIHSDFPDIATGHDIASGELIIGSRSSGGGSDIWEGGNLLLNGTASSDPLPNVNLHAFGLKRSDSITQVSDFLGMGFLVMDPSSDFGAWKVRLQSFRAEIQAMK